MADGPTPRLRKLYEDSIIKAMTEKFGYKNAMQVPRLEKIVLNMGVGAAVGQPSLLEGAVKDLARIASVIDSGDQAGSISRAQL